MGANVHSSHPASIPVQAPILFSATMHCTAPSPIVKPEDPVCEQRHCNEGVVPHRLDAKFASRKDSKQPEAHSGMKSEMSVERLNAAAAEARSGIVAHTAT